MGATTPAWGEASDGRLFYRLTVERVESAPDGLLLLSWYEKPADAPRDAWRQRVAPINEADLARLQASYGPDEVIDLLPALQ